MGNPADLEDILHARLRVDSHRVREVRLADSVLQNAYFEVRIGFVGNSHAGDIVGVGLGNLIHVWDRRSTWAAPGRPEVKDHELSLGFRLEIPPLLNRGLGPRLAAQVGGAADGCSKLGEHDGGLNDLLVALLGLDRRVVLLSREFLGGGGDAFLAEPAVAQVALAIDDVRDRIAVGAERVAVGAVAVDQDRQLELALLDRGLRLVGGLRSVHRDDDDVVGAELGLGHSGLRLDHRNQSAHRLRGECLDDHDLAAQVLHVLKVGIEKLDASGNRRRGVADGGIDGGAIVLVELREPLGLGFGGVALFLGGAGSGLLLVLLGFDLGITTLGIAILGL